MKLEEYQLSEYRLMIGSAAPSRAKETGSLTSPGGLMVRVLAARLHSSYASRGSVLLETAIVLPLAVLIIAGILDLGYVFQQSTIVYQASRAGARTASAMTGELAAADLAQWCSGAASTQRTINCADILVGEFGGLSESFRPLKSGLYMACRYLKGANLAPHEWEVTAAGPLYSEEDNVPMRAITVSVARSVGARRCIFCLQQQIGSIILNETSSFPVYCQ